MSRVSKSGICWCSSDFKALLPSALVPTLLTALLATLLSGCTASQAPCLQYETRSIQKTILLRGHGSVDVIADSLVCASREELYSLN